MSDESYTPLIDRERETKSRIHEELTKPARERLAVITNSMSKYGSTAFDYLIKRVGKSPFTSYYQKRSVSHSSSVKHENFIMEGKTLHVLSYIEIIIKEYHTDRVRRKKAKPREKYAELSHEPSFYKPNNLAEQTIDDIENVLITEGILWDLNRLGKGGVVEFVPLESEGMKEIDEELQEIAAAQPWGTALKGYNDALDRYLNGEFDEHIPKKLYYSIEEVLKTICVDEEGWTDNRELTHSEYLDILKENGVYDAHGVTATELTDLLDSLERMVAKVSDERKQRHAYHDRAYATLLIHQIGAYIYFLISRYEDYSS